MPKRANRSTVQSMVIRGNRYTTKEIEDLLDQRDADLSALQTSFDSHAAQLRTAQERAERAEEMLEMVKVLVGVIAER